MEREREEEIERQRAKERKRESARKRERERAREREIKRWVLLLEGSRLEKMGLLVTQLLFAQLWVFCRCVESLHELVRAGRVNQEYAVGPLP